MTSPRFYRILSVLVVFLVGCAAWACPLCEDNQGYTPETRAAYESITLLLALMPVLGSIAIFTWIYRRYKRAESTTQS